MHAWPTPFTEDQTRYWIQRQLESYPTIGIGRLAVEDRATGEYLGDCGIMRVEINGKLEYDLGYIFRRSAWGQGYASEAAAAVLQYARETLRLPRIVANMAVTHAASRRVAEKIGFKHECEFLNVKNRNLPTFLLSIEDPA